MNDIKNCILNKGHENLEIIQQNIRLEIINLIVDRKRPVTYEEVIEVISRKLLLKKEIVEITLDKLNKEKFLVQDEEKNIKFIYPVSAYPTQYIVELSDGRSLYAMCAIDALGCAVTFNQDIKIKSRCSNTDKEILLEIKNGQITKTNNKKLVVLHVDFEKYENWAASC